MPTGGDGTAYMGEAAVSQQQQKFMGMVYAYKKGEMPNASDEVKTVSYTHLTLPTIRSV